MTDATTQPRLPEGLTTRPLQRSDATAVFELMADQERHDLGAAQIEEADIVADWSKPSHDLAARSVGIFDGDDLVGYGELMAVDRADAAVRPDWRGRGLGTWIAAWLQALGRREGSPVIGMPVPQGSDGDRLLAALGYDVRWTSWILQLPEGAEIAPRPLPDGYRIREATVDDHRAVHEVIEDAFLEWSVRERESYDDFRASVVERPGFEPWNLRVATDADDTVVAVALVLISESDGRIAYVDRLATRRDQRNRGIAQALLADAFAEGRARGAVVSELATDSRTGALGLYEKVGMVVTSTWVNRAIRLDDAP